MPVFLTFLLQNGKIFVVFFLNKIFINDGYLKKMFTVRPQFLVLFHTRLINVFSKTFYRICLLNVFKHYNVNKTLGNDY